MGVHATEKCHSGRASRVEEVLLSIILLLTEKGAINAKEESQLVYGRYHSIAFTAASDVIIKEMTSLG